MYPLKQSTALTVPFFAHDVNGDGVTGLVDAGFTKRISKNGGAFAAMTVTITEMENGWYSLPLSTAHTDTLGVLTISISHSSIKRVNMQFRVHARINDDLAYPAVSGRSSAIDASGRHLADVDTIKTQAVTASGGITFPAATLASTVNITAASGVAVSSLGANVITAASIAAAALNGKGDWNIGKTGYSLTQTFPANFASLAITGGGAVTVGTNNDKTGYALTQTFPTNFASLSITAAGLVTLAPVTHTGAVIPTVSTATAVTTVNGLAASVITAASIAADAIQSGKIQAGALNGKGDWNVGKTGYSLSSPQTVDITGNLSGSVGSVVGLTAANLDAPVSSRLAAATYVAPDNATISAIDGKLPATLVGGRIDASVGNMATDVLTAAALALDARNEIRDSILLDSTPFNGAFIDAAISSVAVTAAGSALNKLADTFALPVGNVVIGTISDTFSVNNTYHQIEDVAGEIDARYTFVLDPERTPVSFGFTGYANGVNDPITISAFRWTDSSWVQIGTVVGQAGAGNVVANGSLFKSMVGTGANLGEVIIRLHNTGLTAADWFVDQLVVGYAVDAQGFLFSGTAVSATTTTLVLPNNASSVNDFYRPSLARIVSGTGAGQSRRVDGYVGATRTLSVATAWVVVPDATSEVQILPWASVRVSDIDAGVIAESNLKQVNGDAVAAQNLEASAETIVRFTAQAGSTATVIKTNLTETTSDHYKGRIVIFRTGALAGQASDITAYNGSNGDLTVTLMTDAPVNGDTGVIV